jgi:predicted kinase
VADRRLYLVRGLPGSGKSTIARMIAPDANFCADSWFGVAEGGGYARPFNPAELPQAHAACQKGVEEAMQYGEAVIAVHNTFVRQWELDPYRRLAETHGYTVTEITCVADHGSVHEVPAEAIDRMRAGWEPTR